MTSRRQPSKKVRVSNYLPWAESNSDRTGMAGLATHSRSQSDGQLQRHSVPTSQGATALSVGKRAGVDSNGQVWIGVPIAGFASSSSSSSPSVTNKPALPSPLSGMHLLMDDLSTCSCWQLAKCMPRVVNGVWSTPYNVFPSTCPLFPCCSPILSRF